MPVSSHWSMAYLEPGKVRDSRGRATSMPWGFLIFSKMSSTSHSNPARPSPLIAALFPAAAVAVALEGPAPISVLMPEEHRSIAHCADKRIRDFTAGRACAHRALAELGIEDFSLLAGQHREPLWPPDIVGSITHTDGFAAVAVARQRDLRGVGIDCEVADSVDEDLWSRICTPSEVERMQALPPDERARHAALIFAAKEAFYKCQFPLTGDWVGFEDVVIEPDAGAAGCFRIVPQTPLRLGSETVAALHNRFQFHDRWVIAAVTAQR